MFRKFAISIVTALTVFAINPSAKADDIEIYFGNAQPVNILLVLDVSGSMGWSTRFCDTDIIDWPYTECYPTSGEQSRLQIMQQALTTFLNDLDDTARVGFYSYGGSDIILQEEVKSLAELDSGITHRQKLLASIAGLTANGGTPLGKTMYQAAEYLRGNNDTFNTPITANCGIGNNMILLTDGLPNTFGNTDDDDIEAITGQNCPSNDAGKQCMQQLAGFLASNDQVSGVTPSNVSVSTIAFALNNQGARDFLQTVANNGQGTFTAADNAQGLADAFAASITSGVDQSQFVAPSVPLSQSNRLSSGNELYLAMFKPEGTQLWHGNLKKYYLKNGQIVDKNEVVAVDANGQFIDTASSAWSVQDGNDVAMGGAAQAISLPRDVYSNILEKNLWTNKNKIQLTNNKITRDLLGLDASVTDDVLDNHISWLYNLQTPYDTNGDGVDDAMINRFGDPLHSRPVIVRYASDIEVAFVGTNEGYLHAINPANNSGDELWSFIPRQLLPNVSQLANDSGLTDPSNRIYGLDGDITVYHFDDDNDGLVDSGEKAYLYVGMRRGGKNYYAIDISERTKPQLMFTITGDQATYDETRTGALAWDPVIYYEGLGETWSKPIVGHMKWGNQEKLVMVFGGGYDSDNQDNEDLVAGTSDNVGNNIFIADAITGQKLWDAKTDAVSGRSGDDISSLMTNSFASDLAIGDLTGSGTIEVIYAADTGGQVFRFDIHAPSSPSGSTSIKGAKLAKIQGTGKTGNRRFYNKPDVSFARLQGKTIGMVAIGSGYRAHPLQDGTVDRFYTFFDEKVLSKTFETSALSESDLFDVTNKITDVEGEERFASIFDIFNANKNGWMLQLETSEKVLADSVTINYRTFFTTYKPNNDPTSCAVTVGDNKLYAISILDGRPAFGEFDSNNNGVLDQVSERSTNVNYVGIAPGFTVLFPDNSNGNDTSIVSYVGTEQVCSGNKCDFANELQTVKWRELTKSELEEIKNN